MTQAVGVIDIVWQGRRIPVEKGAKFKLPGYKNNPLTYGAKAARAREFVAGEVTAKTALEKGQSFASVYGDGEGELQLQCDTGQTYVCPDAFLTDGPPEITGGELLELKWTIGTYEEIMS
ncbi:phage tail tube protein [Azorhizobium doebereinerae]|uniref:phage tail tube protein n=1 Tax=Azorhizobium doebereinerae TaxID=281091 RepID=UPI0004083681|nr:phage tail tube protein [Azorhizobium doebereinerae]